MPHNIFLDFLNRDSRQMYGLYDARKELHIKMLIEAINVAVLLCEEFCIMPPGFLAECDLAKIAIDRRIDYLKERTIRLPMRENSLEDFFNKKQREYLPFYQKYLGLFNEKTEKKVKQLLRKAPEAIITRNTNVGVQMVSEWEEGIDREGSIWKQLSQGVPTTAIDHIRSVPKILRAEGIAVTWPAILNQIRSISEVDPSRFRYAVQHHYFRVYICEYDLKILSNLPFTRNIDFGLYSSNWCYSYELAKIAAESARVWKAMQSMCASSILKLKQQASFFEFRRSFDAIGAEAKSLEQIREAFAISKEQNHDLIKTNETIESSIPKIIPAKGRDLSLDDIETVGYSLNKLTYSALSNLRSIQTKSRNYSQTQPTNINSINTEKVSSKTTKTMTSKFTLAIFTALKEERDILIKEWQLENKYGQIFWVGERNNVELLIYSSSAIGRVPAAITTTKALQENKPDMLIIAGIAGGFSETKVKLGDILVANQIVDLATRKIDKIDNSESIAPEFRPITFETDQRIIKFLDSGSFKRFEWETRVVEKAEWPEGLRPTLKFGPVASLDEVVSNDSWRELLLKAWPKLLGVEMEAGGVCAAAKEFGITTAVIRGVSDLADPRKSDSQWRGRAMKTVTYLIENIIDSGILFQKVN